MKIKLIFPHVAHATLGDMGYIPKLFAKKTKEGRYSKLLVMPLALPTLAALTPPGIDVRLVDESIDGIDYDEKVDIAGISFYSTIAPHAYEIAAELRRRGVYVVLGGAHPTLAPEDAAQHADSIFIGEAEDTWPRFISDFQAGKPEKVYRCETPPDLQKPVVPRWELSRPDYYSTFEIQTTRGCPMDCDFCAVKGIFPGKPRTKPIENVVAEVKALKRLTGPFAPLTITFVDDDLLANRAHARRLLEALIPLKIRWWCQCSISIAKDEEMLELAKRSGCDFLLLGIESISQQAQVEVNKAKLNKVSEFKDAIKKIQSYGISIFPGLIVGFDDDDTSIFERTVSFVNESGLDFPMYNMLTPYPGTRLTARLREEGRLFEHRWDELDSYHVLFKPKKMSVEELREGHRWAIRNTYSYEGTRKRLSVARANGSLDVCTPTFGDQMFRLVTTAVLAREMLKQDAEMRRFIRMILGFMWSRPAVKVLALLMVLDRYEFVHRMLDDKAPPAPAPIHHGRAPRLRADRS